MRELERHRLHYEISNLVVDRRNKLKNEKVPVSFIRSLLMICRILAVPASSNFGIFWAVEALGELDGLVERSLSRGFEKLRV